MEHTRCLYLGQVVLQHLVHRASGFYYSVGRKALPQEVLAGNVAIAEVHVGNMVYNLTICFFGHALVEAAVACLHVENRYVLLLGRYGAQARVGIAKHQKGIGLNLVEHGFYVYQNLPYGGGGRISGRVQKIVGLAYSHIIEKDLV